MQQKWRVSACLSFLTGGGFCLAVGLELLVTTVRGAAQAGSVTGQVGARLFDWTLLLARVLVGRGRASTRRRVRHRAATSEAARSDGIVTGCMRSDPPCN